MCSPFILMEFNVAVVKLKYRALTFLNVRSVGTRTVLLSSRVLEFTNFSLIMPLHSICPEIFFISLPSHMCFPTMHFPLL